MDNSSSVRASTIDEERLRLWCEIAEYVSEHGCTLAKASEVFGVAISTVWRACQDAGVDTSRYRSIDDPERVKVLIESAERGDTLQEIGDRLGVTRERARQLLNWAKREFDVADPPEFYRLNNIAEGLGRSPKTIRRAANALGLGRIRGQQRVYTLSDAEAIAEYLDEKPTSYCRYCGTEFEGRATVCSKRCHYRLRSPQAVTKNRAWKRLAQAERQKSPGRWLYLCEACDVSGLEKIQISYLSTIGLVRTRQSPNPRRIALARHGGEKEYSEADVLLAAKLRESA